MKLYKLLFASILLLFISCNTDDGTDVMTESSNLVGTWNVESILTESRTTATIQGISTSSTFTGTSKDEMLTYIFAENPNTVSAEGSYTSVLTLEVPGQDPIIQEVPVPETSGNTTWELENGNSLIFGTEIFDFSGSSGVSVPDDVSFDTNSTVIKSITDSTMVLETVSKGTYESQGANVEFDIKATVSLTK